MPETKNLCAQIPLDLHIKVCEGREQAGLTTAQYITNLLTEYFKIKENGGQHRTIQHKNKKASQRKSAEGEVELNCLCAN